MRVYLCACVCVCRELFAQNRIQFNGFVCGDACAFPNIVTYVYFLIRILNA